MGKGPRPPKEPPPPKPSDDLPPDGDGETFCWEFTPADQTPNAAALKVSDRIIGTQMGKRIILNSDRGSVGFVPSSIAEEIIESIRGSAKKLAGHVLNNDNASLVVELCAV
jgi:hypothetical protein